MKRKPPWLRVKLGTPQNVSNMYSIINKLKLNTVCKEANCPNSNECFGEKKHATFMILGKNCTRSCAFCNVNSSSPEPIDDDEPLRVAQGVKKLGLKHAVITCVTRDDLLDGGASHFKRVINEIRLISPSTTVEVLISDLKGDIDSLSTIVSAKPDIINHNIETISRLYKTVRPQANYQRSLELLQNVKKLSSDIYTKSGFMVGLSETKKEILELLEDLHSYSCDIVTIGQYLQPSKKHTKLVDYIHPDTFDYYKSKALNMGFLYVVSGPLVRSSYNAGDFFRKNIRV